MNRNLSLTLRKLLPVFKEASRSLGRYYPINDDLFGLTDRQKELRQTVFDFAQKELKENKIKFNHRILGYENRRFWEELGKLGLLGVTVEKYYGGQGGCYVDQVIIQEEMARASVISALNYNNQLSQCVYPIHHYGTEEQKLKYLPKLCSGEEIGSVALSNCQKSSLERVKAVKQGDHYILNGLGASHGFDADIVIVYTMTNENEDPNESTAFIVDKSFEGFYLYRDSALKFSFENCKVPEANILTEKEKGDQLLLNCLYMENLILAGGLVGLMQSFCDAAFEKAYKNQLFTHIKNVIPELYTKLCSSRNNLYSVARACDNGHISWKDCAAVFLDCNDNAVQLACDVQAILGEKSYDSNSTTKQFLDGFMSYMTALEEDSRRKIITETISREYSE